jgi:hypothetical protein
MMEIKFSVIIYELVPPLGDRGNEAYYVSQYSGKS